MNNKKVVTLVNDGLNIKQARNVESNLHSICDQAIEDINKMTHLSKEERESLVFNVVMNRIKSMVQIRKPSAND